jgi:hypothetical protein
MKLIAAAIALFAFHAAAQNPAGWQVVKDRSQHCQIAVPPGWIADKVMPSNLTASDKKAKVVFRTKFAGATYTDIVKLAKQMYKPVKTYEETAGRTWFASAPAPGKTGSWYVVLNSSPLCEAQIEFVESSFEATAKQMVNSLKPVK